MSSPSARPLVVALCLVLVYLVWGSTYFALHVVLKEWPPFLTSGTRFFSAGILLVLFSRFMREKWPAPREFFAAIFVGACLGYGNGSVTFAQYLGVESSMMATIVATMPLWVALFSRAAGERMQVHEYVGIAFGVFGAIILTFDASLRKTGWGLLLALSSPMMWGFGSLFSRRHTMPSPYVSSGIQLLVGGVLMTLLGLGRHETFPPGASLTTWLNFFYLLLVGSVVTYTAYMYLLRTTRSAIATSYAFVCPLVAVTIGVGIGRETLSWQAYVAVPFILIAVAMVLWGRLLFKQPVQVAT